MITLKHYQREALDCLAEFFRQTAATGNPEVGFKGAQEKFEQESMPYRTVGPTGLPMHLPYVCLRVPTGGGKTLLACHAVGLAQRELLRADRAMVVWLVPSNTILDQTVQALSDPRHAYRRALETACAGPVEVLSIEDALNMTRASADGSTVVVVATIQSFRVEDATGRRVYATNSVFPGHFENLPADRLAELEPGPDGKPLPCLVNALRLRRPVVIVDEAHNARTDLSFSTLDKLGPSCVIEFSATPDRKKNPSNVLHFVSASELKAAEMVKLPLRVVSREASQADTLLLEAVTLRADLEKSAGLEAQETAEYIRPILLIQAGKVDDCEPLRDRLVEEFGLERAQVVISVGKNDELEKVKDIRAPECAVRVVITVEKLREGWDCPFAYVLCSLRPTKSATAIEQIVGRILRLPGAVRKRRPELNCSYVFSVSPSLPDVLGELRDALEANGFTRAEAENSVIVQPSRVTLPLALHSRTVKVAPADLNEGALHSARMELAGKVEISAAKGEITIFAPLTPAEEAVLVAVAASPPNCAALTQAVAEVRALENPSGPGGPSPWHRREPFPVPLLCLREQGELFEFEGTVLLEHPWKLSLKDADLGDYDPRARPAAVAGVVDVGDAGEVLTRTAREPGEQDFVRALHQQVFNLQGSSDLTEEALIAWIDKRIAHDDIPIGESAGFILKALRGLQARHRVDIATLALDRHRLKDRIDALIRGHRERERKQAFARWLLPEAGLTTDPGRTLDFKDFEYEPSFWYDGAYQFRKHYAGCKPGELKERTAEGKPTEEFRCAQILDEMPEVRFWLRNLARKPGSFRLQTSKDWFYPDFVCQLTDARILVVEYKGGHLMTDAAEKRAVGEVWASRSNGRCLFKMTGECVDAKALLG